MHSRRPHIHPHTRGTALHPGKNKSIIPRVRAWRSKQGSEHGKQLFSLSSALLEVMEAQTLPFHNPQPGLPCAAETT